jgi:hypothetical protein
VWYVLVQYTSEQRVFLYDTFVKSNLVESVGKNVDVNFGMKELPAYKKFSVWWINLEGLLLDKKQKHKRWVLTEGS